MNLKPGSTYFLVVCLFVISLKGYSQLKSPILLQQLHSSKLSLKEQAKELNAISWLNYKAKKDSTLFYAKKALKFAEKHQIIDELFTAYLQLAEINRVKKKYNTSKENLIKAAELLKKSPYTIYKERYYLVSGSLALSLRDYNKAENQLSVGYDLKSKSNIYIDICLKLAVTAKKKKNLLRAESYFKEAISILKSTQNFKKAIKATNSLGTLMAQQQQYKKAATYYNESLQLAILHKDLKGQSSAFLNLGNVFYFKGNWDKAISYYIESAQIKETLKDNTGIAKIHNNIAAIYKQQKRFTKSLTYFRKSEHFYQNTNDSIKLAETWINIASVHVFLKNPKTGLSFLQDALLYLKHFNRPKTELIAQTNIALAYNMMKQFNESLLYLAHAEKKAQQLKKSYSLVIIYNLYGVNYYELKKYNKAIDFYQKSYDLANKMDILNEQKKALFGLYETEQKKKNYQKSLIWHEKYTQIKDSLFNTNSATKILELQEKYETKQKEQEIAILNKENTTISLENQLKTDQLKLSLISISFVIVLIVILSLFFRQKSKNQKALLVYQEAQNKEQINQLIQKQEIRTLESVLTAQQNERKKLASDIHDNLGSYLATIKYQHEATKVTRQHEKKRRSQFKSMSQLISSACAEVRAISHQMATGESFDFSLIPAIQKLVQRIRATKQFNIQFIHLLDALDASQETELALYKIIQELLSNVLKHAKATEVILQINGSSKDISIIVEDNGIGFDITNSATNGIGLTNIIQRVEHLKGKTEINSSINLGTTILIILPTCIKSIS